MMTDEIEANKAYVDKEIADAIRVTLPEPQPGGLAHIVQPLTGLTFQQVKPMLSFMPCGIQIDLETGEVVIPEGLPLTDAAKAFWAAVQHMSGYRAPGFW
jgi:hypothetical protein